MSVSDILSLLAILFSVGGVIFEVYNSNKMNQGVNLNYLLNNIEKLTENQSGCRLLQNKIQQNSF